MFPVLFRIPLDWFPGVEQGTYFPVRMFGVMVILGFLAGTWIVSRRLDKQGVMKSQDTFDFCFYLLAMGILGARVLYVLQNFDEFKGKFLSVFAIWEGGLVWYGGMVASTLFAFWWLWKKKLPVLKVADAAALGVCLALAIGRWGCFCAGDDYGTKITAQDGTPITSKEFAPWYAIQVPSADPDDWRYKIEHVNGMVRSYCETPREFRAPYFLHPVQLYSSIGNLAVFAILLLLVARIAKRPGIIAAWYLFLYPVNRFIVEFWRGDEDRGVNVLGTPLSFSQLFGIPIVLLGVVVLKAALAAPPPAPPAPPAATPA